MNYFKYLKKSIPLYVISGALFGAALFSAVAMHRYNNFLKGSVDTFNDINLKREDIKREINQTDSVIGYIRNSVGLKEDRINPEKLILHALDEMKTRLGNTAITVTSFEDASGEKQLPAEIRIPVNDYRAVIDYTGYIESLRLPDFRIKNFALTREETGEVLLSIEGSFAAPTGGGSL